eukprot:1183763-Amphidinium_carterae.1
MALCMTRELLVWPVGSSHHSGYQRFFCNCTARHDCVSVYACVHVYIHVYTITSIYPSPMGHKG